MSQEVEVRLPYSALGTPFRPGIPLFWDNQRFIDWAEAAGYRSVEFHGLRGAVRDILHKTPGEIAAMNEIRSGHVLFNPFTNSFSETLRAVLTRKQDPIRSKEKFNPLVLAFAEGPRTSLALHKLEDAKIPEDFFIVVYPYKRMWRNPFGTYRKTLIQTHPEAFNDQSTAEDFINNINAGRYAGMVWDTYQALGATNSSLRPLQPWEESLPKLLKAGVIKEIGVQAGRTIYIDNTIPTMTWLRSMADTPNHNGELGKMIRMVKDFDRTIPFVVKVTLDGLVAARLIKKSDLLDPNLGKAKQKYSAIADFIKRV